MVNELIIKIVDVNIEKDEYRKTISQVREHWCVLFRKPRNRKILPDRILIEINFLIFKRHEFNNS